MNVRKSTDIIPCGNTVPHNTPTINTDSADIITVNTDFLVNNKICISMNTSFPYKSIPGSTICSIIYNNLNRIIQQYNVKESELILLIDTSKINLKVISIPTIKKIINTLYKKQYSNLLYKCILYNYTPLVEKTMVLIKVFLSKQTANKIIMNNNLSFIKN